MLKAKVKHKRGTARFVFRALGDAAKFQCALTKTRRVFRYRHCSSPMTYRGLAPGRYVFKVRAIGVDGAKANPTTRKFKIPRSRRMTRHSSKSEP